MTVASDSNRHKVQLAFDFKPATAKGECLTLKKGHVAQSGKVVTITIKQVSDMEYRSEQLFESVTLADLCWPSSVKREPQENTDSDAKETETPKSTEESSRATRAAKRRL
jgi:hypothetical protein